MLSWKWLTSIFLLLVTIYFSYGFIDKQFKVSNITFDEKLVPLATPTKEQEAFLEKLLTHPFTYLDRGKQSFVFLSHDKKHVIKFFDARCLKCSELGWFSPYTPESLIRKKERLFEGYKVAFEKDRSHTGLEFVQLAPTHEYSKQAVVYDRFGIKHEIDLSKVPFVVQVKAIPTRRVIKSLLQRSNVEGAKQHLRKIVEMYVTEYRMGIIDRDHNFMYNTGFVDGEPIRIDVGRLYADVSVKDYSVFSLDLHKVAIERVGEWMQRHFPQYREEIVADMQLKLLEVK